MAVWKWFDTHTYRVVPVEYGLYGDGPRPKFQVSVAAAASASARSRLCLSRNARVAGVTLSVTMTWSPRGHQENELEMIFPGRDDLT